MFRGRIHHFLEKLYHDLGEANLVWKSVRGSIEDVDPVLSRSLLEKYAATIPASIRQDFSRIPKKRAKKYSFRIENRDFDIYLFLANPVNADVFFQECVEKMFHWLYILRHSTGHCSKRLAIYLFFTDAKKELPEKAGEPIDRVHVNGAFTYSCQSDNVIYIYRREEWFKVFIHETIHSFGLDFSGMKLPKTCRLFSKTIEELSLFEAYCEILANLVQLAFYIYRPSMRLGTFIRKFETMVQVEQRFALAQAKKLLSHYGLRYQNISMVNYQEKTPAFSYFVIKSILLFYYGEFLDRFDIANTVPFLQFPKTPAGIQSFCDFIEEKHDTEEFSQAIDGAKILGKSMRMTYYG